MTRKTKIRIRKAVAFARKLCLVIFGICLLLTVVSVDGPSIWFPIACFAVGTVCFGIAYFFDYLLWDTKGR